MSAGFELDCAEVCSLHMFLKHVRTGLVTLRAQEREFAPTLTLDPPKLDPEGEMSPIIKDLFLTVSPIACKLESVN